jgi:hypothetical protein
MTEMRYLVLRDFAMHLERVQNACRRWRPQRARVCSQTHL